MLNKKTDEMMEELMSSNNLDAYLKKNSDYMVDETLCSYLNNILKKSGAVKSQIVKKTELSEVQGYQIFQGKRKPSRDALISICAAMEIGIDETQKVLKIGGFAPLYPKNERDAIIIKGIQNKSSVACINEALYDKDKPTINQ